MTTEAGTQGCLALISCKHHLEAALDALQGIDNSSALQGQLLTIHAQVDHMHEQLRHQALERQALPQQEPQLMQNPV